MANCPFLSTSETNVNCLESDCQLWDITQNECSIKASSILLNHIKTNDLRDIKSELQEIIDKLEHFDTSDYPDMEDKLQQLIALLTHFDTNDYPDMEDKLQHIFDEIHNIHINHFDTILKRLLKAALLIQEYEGNEDVDENNAIYGKDFKIDENDSQIPRLIKNIQKSPDFPDNLDAWTWNEYLQSLSSDYF